MHDPSNKDLLAEFMEEDEDMEVTVHKRASTVAMVGRRENTEYPEKSRFISFFIYLLHFIVTER